METDEFSLEPVCKGEFSNWYQTGVSVWKEVGIFFLFGLKTGTIIRSPKWDFRPVYDFGVWTFTKTWILDYLSLWTCFKIPHRDIGLILTEHVSLLWAWVPPVGLLYRPKASKSFTNIYTKDPKLYRRKFLRPMFGFLLWITSSFIIFKFLFYFFIFLHYLFGIINLCVQFSVDTNKIRFGSPPQRTSFFLVHRNFFILNMLSTKYAPCFIYFMKAFTYWY